MKKANPNFKLIANNKKARYDYFLSNEIEVGLVLYGSEIKSLRFGGATIQESYVSLENDELWIINSYIPKYKAGGKYLNHDERRKRKLLIKKRELKKMSQLHDKKGYTIIASSLYFNHKGLAKLKIATAKGKKEYDKRATIKEREWKRSQSNILKQF